MKTKHLFLIFVATLPLTAFGADFESLVNSGTVWSRNTSNPENCPNDFKFKKLPVQTSNPNYKRGTISMTMESLYPLNERGVTRYQGWQSVFFNPNKTGRNDEIFNWGGFSPLRSFVKRTDMNGTPIDLRISAFQNNSRNLLEMKSIEGSKEQVIQFIKETGAITLTFKNTKQGAEIEFSCQFTVAPVAESSTAPVEVNNQERVSGKEIPSSNGPSTDDQTSGALVR